MAATPSTMRPLGSAAPRFELPDPRGGKVRLEDAAGAKGTLVMFISNHCPYVKHVRAQLAAIGRDYADSGIGILAIGSNDVERYPDDAPDRMAAEVQQVGYVFPYLWDETQEVARAYGAACTPDLFLFDGELRLAYRGQLDDSRPGSGVPVTGKDLRAAMDALVAGEPVPADQKPSIGCNIKWKPGNEPS